MLVICEIVYKIRDLRDLWMKKQLCIMTLGIRKLHYLIIDTIYLIDNLLILKKKHEYFSTMNYIIQPTQKFIWLYSRDRTSSLF